MLKILMMTVTALGAGFAATAAGTQAKTAPQKATAVAKDKDGKKSGKISLADARTKIDACIRDEKTMTATMQSLSAPDQVSFLAEVNAAISKLPAAEEERTATFVRVNVAAMRGAEKGNLVALVSETFATVPVASLPAVSETYAEELFNRGADASATYTDENFAKIAQKTVESVDTRCQAVDNTGVRDTLAVLMFIRSSNGTPVELPDTLSQQISDPVARQNAVSTWIPEAMKNSDYSEMLASAGVETEEKVETAKPLTGTAGQNGPEFMDGLMADLANETVGSDGKVVSTFSGQPDSTTSTTTPGETASRTTGDSNPSTSNPVAPWNPANPRESGGSEPGGYQNQTTGI